MANFVYDMLHLNWICLENILCPFLILPLLSSIELFRYNLGVKALDIEICNKNY